MNIIIISLIIVAAIIVSACAFIWTIINYRKQKEIIVGQNYRKMYGLFDTSKYSDTQDAIKTLQWVKQKNAGLEPETFNKKLEFINYFEGCNPIIAKKGDFHDR